MARRNSVAELKREIELLKSKLKRSETAPKKNRRKPKVVLTIPKAHVGKKNPIKKKVLQPPIWNLAKPPVWHQAEIVEPKEYLHLPELSGFKLKEERTFQDVAKQLMFETLINYDGYEGGYEQFLLEFDPFNKRLLRESLTEYNSLKVNYCIHVQYWSRKHKENIEIVYESENYELYGIEFYD